MHLICIKVIDLMHTWGKPSPLNYTCLTLTAVMIIALAAVKTPSDLNLLEITRGLFRQLRTDIFKPVFGAKNVRG